MYLLGAFLMTLDHIGYSFGYPVLQLIGRFAMPVFLFGIAEGVEYTRERLAYLMRVFVAGLVSQPVYFLFTGNEKILPLNILFAFSFLLLLDIMSSKLPDNNRKNVWFGFLLLFVILEKFNIHFLEYQMPAFVLYSSMRVIDERFKEISIFVFAACYLILSEDVVGAMQMCLLAPIVWFSELQIFQKKIVFPVWFKYGYYPMHMLVLYLIKLFLGL